MSKAKKIERMKKQAAQEAMQDTPVATPAEQPKEEKQVVNEPINTSFQSNITRTPTNPMVGVRPTTPITRPEPTSPMQRTIPQTQPIKTEIKQEVKTETPVENEKKPEILPEKRNDFVGIDASADAEFVPENEAIDKSNTEPETTEPQIGKNGKLHLYPKINEVLGLWNYSKYFLTMRLLLSLPLFSILSANSGKKNLSYGRNLFLEFPFFNSSYAFSISPCSPMFKKSALR